MNFVENHLANQPIWQPKAAVKLAWRKSRKAIQ